MLVWKVCDPCYYGKEIQLRDSSPEAFERLRAYVQKRLLDSGVIPQHHTNPVDPESIAAHIVYDSWRQCDTYYYADLYIKEAIKFPPDPIDKTHFSLKAFAQLKK